MYYQVELFEEMSLPELQAALNDFLMMLKSERVIKIEYNNCSYIQRSGEVQTMYTALVVYTYKEN
ncbi:MAG TPA: hypothetical protein DCY93_00890 [Firmicutes bacterium]|nr:hypothetical protein [Bacillota bacterium]